MKEWTSGAAHNNARWCDAVCRAHGTGGSFLPHMWVSAHPVPRFYPNAVTLAADKVARREQRETLSILANSNLPGHWAVKDSFGTLDLSRSGFEILFDAHWVRCTMPREGAVSDIVWQRETEGAAPLPFDDPGFAMFTGRRGFKVVAGGMFYRTDDFVGLSNVIAESADAVAVWQSLALLAARTFPLLPVVGYESGRELKAAEKAGFERGDRLRVWVRSAG